MTDKTALKEASKIVSSFWGYFERATEPRRCSKLAYLEALEDLKVDVDMRIEAVKAEIRELE